MTFPNYLESLEAYNNHLTSPELDFFKAHDAETGLSTAQAILSLGAGDGQSEAMLQKTGLLTSLRSYHAVEPDPRVSAKLKARLPTLLPNVEICHYLSTADVFNPPVNTYDVILMMKMISYVKDKVGLIQRALTWLKADGKLIIEMYKRGSIEKCGTVCGHAGRLYTSDNLAKDLRSLELQFKEHLLHVQLHGHAQSRKIANMWMLKEVDDDEFKQFQSIVMEESPDGCEHQLHGVFIIQKQKTE